MGVESSILEECSLQPPLSTGSESLWEIRHGITFDNDVEITVFTEKSKKKQSCLWSERNIKVIVLLFSIVIILAINGGFITT
jgi:hypothetical protein